MMTTGPSLSGSNSTTAYDYLVANLTNISSSAMYISSNQTSSSLFSGSGASETTAQGTESLVSTTAVTTGGSETSVQDTVPFTWTTSSANTSANLSSSNLSAVHLSLQSSTPFAASMTLVSTEVTTSVTAMTNSNETSGTSSVINGNVTAVARVSFLADNLTSSSISHLLTERTTTATMCEVFNQYVHSNAPASYLPYDMVVLESVFDSDLGILAAIQFQTAPSDQTHLISIAPADQSSKYLLSLGNLSWPSIAYNQNLKQLFLIDCQRSQVVMVNVTCPKQEPIDANFSWSDVVLSFSSGPSR